MGKIIKHTKIREIMKRLLTNKTFIKKFISDGGTMELLNKKRIKLGLDPL